MTDFENRLEQILRREDNAELPYGHPERFAQKLEKLEKEEDSIFRTKIRKVSDRLMLKKIGWVVIPAIFVIGAFIYLHNRKDNSIQQFEQNYRAEMVELGSRLTDDSKKLSEGTKEEAIYSISSIIAEDEDLMALQLPDDLPKKEKQRIIKEYYNQKMEGLKKIQTFIAMNNEDIE